MTENFDFLKNPFEELTNEKKNEFQNKCSEIAENLFNNFCIQCGEKKFYFAEIEFYYYEKSKWENEWNKVTYARDGYDAGTLFYHLSGVDICFDSKYNDNRFGGILIRSLKREEKLITGPLNCKDELLNACKGNCMPILKELEPQNEIIPMSTKRLLGKTAMIDNIDGDYNLCFYNGNIKDWNTERTWYDKRKGEIKKVLKKYSIDRNIPTK